MTAVQTLAAAVGLLASRHRRRYFSWLTALNHDVDIRGLRTQGPFSLDAQTVYVDVSLVPRPIHQASGDPLTKVGDSITSRLSIWDLLGEWPPRTLAIVGPPGIGKTSLLRHVTLALASGRPPIRSLRDRIPIVLTIRDHAQAVAGNPELPLIAAVRASLPTRLRETAPWLERRMGNGNCLIMFDGVDEVADPEHRRSVMTWIERQTAAHPGNGFIVTSRPYGYQSNPVTSAEVLQVRSLTSQQAEQFIKRWYLATEIRRSGRRDDTAVLDAQKRAEDLLHRLNDNLDLYDLAVNPLLLTMIAHVHYYRGVLPGGRHELYREICQVFLGNRQEAKGLTSQLSATQRESVLKHLALEMMKARCRDIDASTAARLIRDELARVAPGVRPETFLAETEQQSGLLVQREQGMYAFSFLPFQEYLASAKLADRDGGEFLAQRIDDLWWREVTLLYSANADAGPIVAACMRQDTVRSLLLALDCAEVARELDPEIRRTLDDLLLSEANSEDPARAAFVGQVLLVRKLRDVRRSDDGVARVNAPITIAEFDLFLRAASDSAQYRPAYWTLDLVTRSPDSPVTGLPAVSTEAFCAWAGSLDEWSYNYEEDKPNTAEDYDVGTVSVSLDFPFSGISKNDAASGRFGSSKQVHLLWVLSMCDISIGPFLVEGDLFEWLDDGIGLATGEEIPRALRSIRQKIARYRAAEDAQSLLAELSGLWQDWGERQRRFADDLVPLMVGAYRLSEALWAEQEQSLAREAAGVLDRVILLHWRASGMATTRRELRLRRARGT